MLLEGKTALITGAGRGIGRGIALAFARQGCRIAAVARTEEEVGQTVAEVEKTGSDAIALVADVTKHDEVQVAVQAALDRFGQIGILVNNAGYADFKPFDELSLDDWSYTMDVNVFGVVRFIRAVLPSMKSRGSGRIINISSVAGVKPIPKQSAYCASKAALNALSKTLAMELREHNIAVNAICPGGVDTRLAADAMPERDRAGWMTPADIAHVALFLATQSPRATTDEIIIRRFGSVPVGG